MASSAESVEPELDELACPAAAGATADFSAGRAGFAVATATSGVTASVVTTRRSRPRIRIERPGCRAPGLGSVH